MESLNMQTNGKAGSATCPVCGTSFECKLSTDCWCATVKVPPEVKEYLAGRYETCLCRSCLEELIERAEAGKLL